MTKKNNMKFTAFVLGAASCLSVQAADRAFLQDRPDLVSGLVGTPALVQQANNGLALGLGVGDELQVRKTYTDASGAVTTRYTQM